jgi:hypothetical protein
MSPLAVGGGGGGGGGDSGLLFWPAILVQGEELPEDRLQIRRTKLKP